MNKSIKKKDTTQPDKAYKNAEFLKSADARTLRILSEYLEPLSRLKRLKVNNTVLFFGSSRFSPDANNSLSSQYYWEAEKLAYYLAKWAIQLKPKGKNFVICTGGGPGIMEAANRGAFRAGGNSIGMNISIPSEQYTNQYVPPEYSFLFHYFFMRKFWLINKAKAVVAFPGGFGTLDEVFEVLTLLQSNKIHRTEMCIILYGEKYWKKTINFNSLLEHKTISKEDLNLFQFCSSPEEAFEHLKLKLTEFI